MYKVLLADDEPLILEGLAKEIPWEDFRQEVAFCASNGMDAWETVRRDQVNIVITDIRMPKLNGLELIRRIRQANLPIRCIVLSGYDDFAYVKESLRLGIENYWLKPINFDECFSTLSALTEKLDAEQRKVSLYEAGLSVLRENILRRLMTGEIDNEELLERCALLSIDLSGGFLSASVTCQQKEKEGLLAFLRKKVENEGRGYVLSERDQRTLLLLRSASPDDSWVTVFAREMRAAVPGADLQLGSYQPNFQGVFKSTFQLGQSAGSSSVCGEKAPPSSRSEVVSKLCQYLDENYGREMSLQTIALEWSMNPLYLGQLFKSETGAYFTEYLNRMRVERSKALLRQKKSIREVAAEVGYLSASYYCSMFRKYVGVTPREYREGSV